jgi:hypothetical protein
VDAQGKEHDAEPGSRPARRERVSRLFLLRRSLVCVLGLVTALLVLGCGSGSQPSAPQPNQETEISPEAEEPTHEAVEESQTEVGGPLSNVGTITTSPEKDMAFVSHYSLGPLMYASEGTPPEGALEACFPSSPPQIARSVFARGKLTVTYSEGSLPVEEYTTNTLRAVNANEEGAGLMAIEVGGEWYCRTSFYLSFEPGGSQTFPIWIIVEGVLTNGRPRVPASTYSGWYFNPIILSSYGGDETIHGPGAASCEREWEGTVERLFLYNRSGRC